MANSTEKFNIVYNNYPEEFNISQRRNAKYWKKGEKPTKKLIEEIEKGISFYKRKNDKDKTEYLFNSLTRSFVVKNIKTVGTPRVQVINSQLFYEGGMGSEWKRSAIKDFLKFYFTPDIVRKLPEKIFTRQGEYIHFEYIFYYPFKKRKEENKKYQDYINHFYIRAKVFEDTIVGLGIIADDNADIVRGGYGRYVEVNTEEERRLEIKIHFCKNNQRIS